MIEKTVEHRFSVLLLVLLGCLLGIFLYFKMPIELLPRSNTTRLVFLAPAQGGNANERAAHLSTLLEKAFAKNGLRGKLAFESNRDRSLGIWTPEGNTHINLQTLRNSIRDALSNENASPNFELLELQSSSGSILTLVAERTRSSKISNFELYTLIQTELIGGLRKIPGVAKAQIENSSNREITHSLNKMALLEDPEFAKHAVQKQIKTLSSPLVNVVPVLGSIAIDYSKDNKLSAFEPIETDHLAEMTSLRDGNEVIFVSVQKNSEGNEVEISKKVKSLVETLNKNLKDLQLDVVQDSAVYINSAEENVVANLRDGIILTCICIFVFLRRWYSTVVVSLSIPISLLLTFPILYLVGISRNVMSLAGIALGVGVVVDATLSIVNGIEEHMAKGFSPREASVISARENHVPIAIAVLTTLAVFIPILFLNGLVGDLFYDLAFTVIASQCIAYICAIYITPSLTSMVYEKINLKRRTPNSSDKKPEGEVKSGIFLQAIQSILQKRVAYWAVAAASLLAVVWGGSLVPPSEFLPRAGQGDFRASIFVGADLNPVSAKILARNLDAGLAKSGFKNRISRLENETLRIDFHSDESSTSSRKQIEELLLPIATPYSVSVSELNPLDDKSSNGQDIEFYLNTTEKNRELLKSTLEKIPGITHQRWSNDFRKSASNIDRDDTAFSSMLVDRPHSEGFFASQFQKKMLGIDVSDPKIEGKGPAVAYLDQTNAGIRLHPTSGAPLQKGMLPYVAAMNRENSNAFVVNGQVMERVELTLEGKTTSQITEEINAIVKRTDVPIEWGSGVSESEDSVSKLGLCILIATILTILILYAQNRSLITTTTIMFTFVWGAIGSFPGLAMHRETLNASALVGFILLAGTIVNNGILLMEIVEKNRKLQFTPRDCCMLAARQRTIPVLVTALTTALGMLPMVFETGAGSQMYRALSIVVVYGTLISTPVSLFGIPCMVMIFGDLREYAERKILKILIQARRKSEDVHAERDAYVS